MQLCAHCGLARKFGHGGLSEQNWNSPLWQSKKFRLATRREDGACHSFSPEECVSAFWPGPVKAVLELCAEGLPGRVAAMQETDN
jgi:hypothetical protein